MVNGEEELKWITLREVVKTMAAIAEQSEEASEGSPLNHRLKESKDLDPQQATGVGYFDFFKADQSSVKPVTQSKQNARRRKKLPKLELLKALELYTDLLPVDLTTSKLLTSDPITERFSDHGLTSSGTSYGPNGLEIGYAGTGIGHLDSVGVLGGTGFSPHGGLELLGSGIGHSGLLTPGLADIALEGHSGFNIHTGSFLGGLEHDFGGFGPNGLKSEGGFEESHFPSVGHSGHPIHSSYNSPPVFRGQPGKSLSDFGLAAFGYSSTKCGWDALMFAFVGAGVVLYILYTRVSLIIGKRRAFQKEPFERVIDAGISALEEFEDTISRIGEDGGENDSWISKMFKNFVGPSLGLNDVDNYEMDGLEPPVLDETWGLGDSKYFAPHKDNTNSTETNSTLTSEDKANLRSKRFADEDADFEAKLTANDADEYINSLAGEEKCKVKFWRCMTGVLTGGMHYLSEPEGITGAAKKAMFKMAFSGQLGGFWNALMTIPEARRIKRCMNANDECMTYETIKAEADITLDSNPRLIVNPDFVENKDTSDGAMEFDEETAKKLADEGYGNFF